MKEMVTSEQISLQGPSLPPTRMATLPLTLHLRVNSYYFTLVVQAI